MEREYILPLHQHRKFIDADPLELNQVSGSN